MFFGKGVHLPASKTVLVAPALLILTISTIKLEAIMQFSLFNKTKPFLAYFRETGCPLVVSLKTQLFFRPVAAKERRTEGTGPE